MFHVKHAVANLPGACPKWVINRSWAKGPGAHLQPPDPGHQEYSLRPQGWSINGRGLKGLNWICHFTTLTPSIWRGESETQSESVGAGLAPGNVGCSFQEICSPSLGPGRVSPREHRSIVMKCPTCNHAETRVIDSRPVLDNSALRRRRVCENCEARFTTHERYQLAPLMVAKRDGRREEFSAAKLRTGLGIACSKRPIPTTVLDELVSLIELELRSECLAEVPVRRIGELVMEKLFTLDEVAYVRFASVYQQFDDVRRFAQILDRMGRRGRGKAKGEGLVSEEDGDHRKVVLREASTLAPSASTTGRRPNKDGSDKSTLQGGGAELPSPIVAVFAEREVETAPSRHGSHFQKR